jgi:hypothetical protein
VTPETAAAITFIANINLVLINSQLQVG